MNEEELNQKLIENWDYLSADQRYILKKFCGLTPESSGGEIKEEKKKTELLNNLSSIES